MRAIEEQTILVTGATDGLGRRVARDLAARGAVVLLHGRNSEKERIVLEAIRRDTGNDRLRSYHADFASLAEVRELAAAISADHSRLDVLINNAGLGAGPHPERRETGADGFELRFTVNYLAPFLLTRLLLPLLLRAAELHGTARIVNVASCAQREIDFENVLLENGYSGMRAYSQSKLALIMFTIDLARELAGTGVTANAVHPASLMDTKMVREWFGEPLSTVDEGARAVKRLVLAEELGGVTGEYFDGEQQARAVAQAYDGQARRMLREMAEKWVELKGG